MDLELRTSGRAAKPVEAEFVRELRESDLPLLKVEKGVDAPPIKRLRDSHHQLARILATGARPAEASLITGYSSSRISILQADPAFQELLEFYRANENVAAAAVQDRLLTLGLTAVSILQERMEEEPEDMGTGMLLETAKVGLDRSGHGPQSRNVSVNVNIGLASQLQRARERAGLTDPPANSPSPTLIEGEFHEVQDAAE